MKGSRCDSIVGFAFGVACAAGAAAGAAPGASAAGAAGLEEGALVAVAPPQATKSRQWTRAASGVVRIAQVVPR
jgi:hypothetical protein